MNKRNILIIIPYFIPAYSYGGPVKVAYDHAIGLIKEGYNVTVVTSDVLDSKNRNKILGETIDGIKIIRFRNLSNYTAKFYNLYLPFGLQSWLKNNIKNYDIVHIHDFFTVFTILGSKYAYKNSIKYFIQSHGTLLNLNINSRKKYIKRFIVNLFTGIVKKSIGIFALTNHEKRDIYSLYQNNNIKLLPNGISLQIFEDIHDVDLHKKFNLAPDVKIIAFLGRVQYIKGLDISLKILSELDKKFHDWVFLIIGPDEGEKTSLEELSTYLGIKDKIIWYGEENTQKKYELLKASDLFLFNSRSEGFGLSIIEAIGAGLPVIISDNCPLELVREYHVGEIIDNANITYAVEKIMYILINKDEYIENGKKLLQENYDINKITSDLIAYYND